MEIHVWTDGACRKTAGGYAYIIRHDTNYAFGGYIAGTTNQRMEVTAIVCALKRLCLLGLSENSVIVHTDSKYCIGVMAQGWTRNCNTDLLQEYDRVCKKFKCVRFVWTKGHSSDKLNNLCDKIAVAEVKQHEQ